MKKKYLLHEIIGFTIGALVFGGIGITIAADIQSNTVSYETELNEDVSTVEGALNDLYDKASYCKGKKPSLGDNFAEAIINLYSEDGVDSLYYHDGTGSYGAYEAGDMSYRFSGPSASVNNYVCYGSDLENCPSANLYRIIGIFKGSNDEYQVKLIKASIAPSSMLGTGGDYRSSTYYYWNNSNGTSSTNIWSQSRLNKINLNGNFVAYLNNIDNKWSEYIDIVNWYVGSNSTISTAGAKSFYNIEITNASNSTYTAAIGLIYISDYMYASSPSFWANTSGTGYNSAKSYNWISLGQNEWTITSAYSTLTDDNSSFINSSGSLENTIVGTYTYAQNISARPVFYLKSNVNYTGGTGTSADPYRISG